MIDLHIHTINSDGENSSAEVLKMAKSIGLSTVAITDHDEIGGIEEAVKVGKELGIRVIPGIEITSYDCKEIHILGYNIDYSSKVWKEYKEYNIDICRREKECIFNALNDMGIPIKEHEIYEYAEGRSDFKYFYVVKWLAAHGYGNSTKEAYDLYFLNGPLEMLKKNRITVENAIKTIHSAGGIAVMAHPVRLGKSDISEAEERINRYINFGLDGVEAIYSMHSDEQIEYIIDFCIKKGLKITLGSDFHGVISKPKIKLGYGIENNLVKYQDMADFIVNQQNL